MESATLDDLMAMNEQLAALLAAGVPVDVGLGGRYTPEVLEKINAAVARGVSRGASLAEAVESNRAAAPPAYLRTVELAIRSGDFPAALAGSTQVADLLNDSRNTVRLALFYPLVLCCVAYVGLVGLCLFLVPVLEGVAGEFRAKPGRGLGTLQALRDTLPIWVAIPPAALVLLFGWRRYRIRHAQLSSRVARSIAWLPGMSRAIDDERRAIFAGLLSKLLAEGMPFGEALPLAADACGDAKLSATAQELAAELELGRLPSDASRESLAFPPFLRWALWHAEESVGRVGALAMAADLYAAAARRRTARLGAVLPVLACVFLGGGVTLLYGLALFVPVVEMLRSVS
jgi:type II secretory pathway component PulF